MKKNYLSKALLFLLAGTIVLMAACGGGQGGGHNGGHDSIPNQDSIPDTLHPPTTSYGPCFTNPYCNDTICQDSIVLEHAITSTQFNTMVTAYGTPASKTTYTVAQLNTMMNGLNCTNGDCLAYNYVTGTGAIQVFAYPVGSTATILGKYAIAFIQGVKNKYNLSVRDCFEFHKAKTGANVETVCIRVTKGGANTPVYWADLVSNYP